MDWENKDRGVGVGFEGVGVRFEGVGVGFGGVELRAEIEFKFEVEMSRMDNCGR